MALQQPASGQSTASNAPFAQSTGNLTDLDGDSSNTERDIEDTSETGAPPPPYEESQLSSNMPRGSPPPLRSRRLSGSSESHQQRKRDERSRDLMEESNQTSSKPYVPLLGLL